MSKFFGYDANMENAIAKITTEKLSLMSGIVAPDKAYLTGSGSTLTLQGGVLFAVGDSVFKTEETTLSSSHFDATVSAFEEGKDYCVYICDPTDGDDTDFTSEVYRISLNTTYPNGYSATNSRKIGGFHYGKVRAVNAQGVPISSGGTAMGSGWKTNVAAGIVPNSVWTILNRPTCDPTGMAKIGSDFWADIYLASDNGSNGLKSAKGVNPITGTEGLNWYIANEKAQRVGKRLPSYAEWCQMAYGSPQGEDGNNTYAWSATSNSARTTTGNVANAVSAKNLRDCVGNVWEWVDELMLDPTASSWGWQTPMSSDGVGDIYMPSATALRALMCGGGWGDGARGGSRAAYCSHYPWYVGSTDGVRCVCDSL